VLDDAKMFDANGLEAPVAGGAAGNRLLAALPPDAMARLTPAMRPLALTPGQILFEPGDLHEEVILPAPRTAVALLSVLKDRRPVETAVIGCEGGVGGLIGAGQGPVFARGVVMTGGAALRVDAAAWNAMLDASPTARQVVNGYLAALLAQVQQGVACAAVHPVEERAARWMLALEDRLGDRSLPLTQEALADLLGVRRTTITRVIANLETRGLIRHRRSRIIVMDRAGLEGAGCECHAQVRAQFERAAPGLYPDGATAGRSG
jgi:CRP-like cAMP-binding protein